MLASLSYLHAGGHNLPYGGPKSALEYYKNGGIVDVFPLGPGPGWDTFPKELLEISTLEELDLGLSDPTIPEEVVKLNKLRKLRIVGGSKNLILPKSIAKMKKLKYLSIERANIENLEQVCRYTQIETLELKSMDLKELPECIGHLMNLKELNLEHNNLKTLPSSIVNLVNLKKIRANFNPLVRSHFSFGVTEEGYSYKEFWDSTYAYDLDLPYFYYLRVFRNHPPKIIPEAYIVTATSGLSVRNKPKLKAKKIGSIPYKLKIAVYEESSNTETIDGTTAPWMRIKAVANGKYMEGWAWGGYLEKFVYTE